MSELKKYQAKFWKKKYEQEKAKANFETHIIDELKSALIVAKPPEPMPIVQPKTEHKSQEAVLLFSDAQIGEKVQKKETGFFDYNVDIFKQELHNLYVSLLNIVNRHRTDCRIDKLNIFFLGDIIEAGGQEIFKGQSARITTDVVEQMFEAQYLIAEFVRSLSAHFVEVYCPGIIGNHARVGMKDQHLSYVNFDYILYQNLKQILSQVPNVKIDADKCWWKIVEVQRWKFYLEHGENIKRYMRIPWYAAEIRDSMITLTLQSIGETFSYYIFAHHHTPFSWDRPRGERICNGTFSQGNPFALSKLASVVRPTQKFFLVHPEVGISANYNIRLDLPREYIE